MSYTNETMKILNAIKSKKSFFQLPVERAHLIDSTRLFHSFVAATAKVQSSLLTKLNRGTAVSHELDPRVRAEGFRNTVRCQPT